MVTNLQIGYGGRLGNQMFQYAACYSAAKRLGVDFVLPIKNVKEIKQDGCYDFANKKWIPYSFKLFDCFNISASIGDIDVDKRYIEPQFQYDPNFVNIENGTSIEGYFQSEKYFEDYKDEILNEFTFKADIQSEVDKYLMQFGDIETVAIHIRRGDYVVNNVLQPVSIDYIQSAINVFDDKDYIFIIVSDDIEYCKQIFPSGYNIEFSNGTSDYFDMCLMASANHNIIANSTFSWWSAYLNKNINKKVVAPKDWFVNKLTNTKDLVPNNWIKI